MSKVLLVLAVLFLCCCITSQQGLARQGCTCIRTVSRPVPLSQIQKVEVIPSSGRCRKVQRIITRKNKTIVCIDLNANWFPHLIKKLEQQNITSTTPTPTSTNTTRL